MARKRQEFDKKTRIAAFARSRGHCELCGVKFIGGKKPRYDHIIPDALGGNPTLENCQCICAPCHDAKTAKEDVPRIAKAVRQHADHIGATVKRGPTLKYAGFRPAPEQRRASKPISRELPPRRPMYEDAT
jgi:5-methylcytosine-specific restriction endonuclease McrA